MNVSDLPTVRAAIICLFCPGTHQVLLGERLVPPFLKHWALPGGRCKAGETPLAAARRELQEETGIQAPNAQPDWELELESVTSNERFEIRCFAFEVQTPPKPSASDELRSRWMAIGDALRSRPMGPATRAALQALSTRTSREHES